MTMRWYLFCAAAFFAAWPLLSNGVPLFPVLAGIAAAAAFTYWRQRRSRAHR